MNVGYAELVARTLVGHMLLEFSHLANLLSIDTYDDIAFLKSGFGASAVGIHLRHIDTFVCAEISIFATVFERVDLVQQIATGDSEICTLNGSIFFQVAYHFVHDGGRYGKTITSKRTSLRI